MRQAVSVTARGAGGGQVHAAGLGRIRLIVEGKDAAGNATAASTYLYSWGDDEGSWQANDNERFDVIADKPSYKVGETARLLLKTTVHNATGLLTIERDGVIEKRLFTVGAGTSTIEVPIKEGYGPNVYASVVLVKGRTGEGGRGVPDHPDGHDDADRRHRGEAPQGRGRDRQAELPPGRDGDRRREGHRRRRQAGAGRGGAVRGRRGRAVADRLQDARSAGDVLRVVGPGRHDRDAVRADRAPPRARRGALRDGRRRRGRAGTFRSRFLATAYWTPRVETDADGHAKVTFQAPDNLTAFRLMAVAADAGDRFGSGDKRMTVSKPLQLLSAMPRFLERRRRRQGRRAGRATTPARPARVTVDATVSGARLRGGAHQEIAVPANGRVPVLFPLRAERAGELKLRVKAALGAENDGLELKLPVHYPRASRPSWSPRAHSTDAWRSR